MGREYELKYETDEETLARIEKCYTGFRTIRMETTYFDDAGGNLGRLHWTLRKRLENGLPVCTIKTDLPDGSRRECETECDDILAAIPELIRLGAPEDLAVFAENGLFPVCGARFTRKAILLPPDEGLVELALDCGCLFGGGKELPFAEAEVECKQGTDEQTQQFAQILAHRFGLKRQYSSKLKRALALAQG